MNVGDRRLVPLFDRTRPTEIIQLSQIKHHHQNLTTVQWFQLMICLSSLSASTVSNMLLNLFINYFLLVKEHLYGFHCIVHHKTYSHLFFFSIISTLSLLLQYMCNSFLQNWFRDRLALVRILRCICGYVWDDQSVSRFRCQRPWCRTAKISYVQNSGSVYQRIAPTSCSDSLIRGFHIYTVNWTKTKLLLAGLSWSSTTPNGSKVLKQK